MLHVTTEVGKPGKKERERRHFPAIHNTGSAPVYRPRGRKYIPHNYGTYIDWVPHGQYIDPQPTESGPDWSSRLRYIPDPENPDYPAAEIWPNNWRSMRPYPLMCEMLEESLLSGMNVNNNGLESGVEESTYGNHLEDTFWDVSGSCCQTASEENDLPNWTAILGDRGRRKYSSKPTTLWTYKQSDNEWLLAPSLTKVGLRCYFNGQHLASTVSENELTHEVLFGKGRPDRMIDKRNEIPEASPGDKCYHVPEYSPSFHKLGSTRPFIRYGPARPTNVHDTFIPLLPLSSRPRQSSKHKFLEIQMQKEVDEVRNLDSWKPAMPLLATTRMPSSEKFTNTHLKPNEPRVNPTLVLPSLK